MHNFIFSSFLKPSKTIYYGHAHAYFTKKKLRGCWLMLKMIIVTGGEDALWNSNCTRITSFYFDDCIQMDKRSKELRNEE